MSFRKSHCITCKTPPRQCPTVDSIYLDFTERRAAHIANYIAEAGSVIVGLYIDMYLLGAYKINIVPTRWLRVNTRASWFSPSVAVKILCWTLSKYAVLGMVFVEHVIRLAKRNVTPPPHAPPPPTLISLVYMCASAECISAGGPRSTVGYIRMVAKTTENSLLHSLMYFTHRKSCAQSKWTKRQI